MSEITQFNHPSELYSCDENGNWQRKHNRSTTGVSNGISVIRMDQQGRNDATASSPKASGAGTLNDHDHEESLSNELKLSSESSVGTGVDESVELEQGTDELARSSPNETGNSTVLSKSRRKRSKAAKTKFPIRLLEMVEDAARKDFEHIVSWTLGGRGCKVHNEEAFATKILPVYFNHSKIRSFHRQLSYWGFERILKGPDKHAYAHPDFGRGQPEGVKSIRRVANKGSAKRKHGVSINLRQAGEIEMDKACLSLGTKTISKNKSKKSSSSPSKPRPVKSTGVLSTLQHSKAPLRPEKKKTDQPFAERPRVSQEIQEPECSGLVDFGTAETAQHGNANNFKSRARLEHFNNWNNHVPMSSTTVHRVAPKANILAPSFSATFPRPLRRHGQPEGEAGQHVLVDPFFVSGTKTHCPSATKVDPGATNTNHHQKSMTTAQYGDVNDVQKNLFNGIMECPPMDHKNLAGGTMESPQIDKAILRQKLRSIYASLEEAECQVIALKELYGASCCSPSASLCKEAKVQIDHDHPQEPRRYRPNYFSPQDTAQDNMTVFDLKTMDRLDDHEDDTLGYGSVSSSGDRNDDEPRVDLLGDAVDIVDAD
jgi:hypothetical protein